MKRNAPNIADQVRDVLRTYLHLKDREYVALALWILHTYVYDHYEVTPRLVLRSAGPDSGKTTALKVIKALCPESPEPLLSANLTGPVIARSMPTTMLLDEADNQGIGRNEILKAVLNSGHSKGATYPRTVKGEVVRFPVFGPVAIAHLKHTPLPPALLSRSVIIELQRSPHKLPRFGEGAASELQSLRDDIARWAVDAEFDLQTDPSLPHTFRNRTADKWRSLVGVAATFGKQWNTRACKTAADFAAAYKEEDISATLLSDIHGAFGGADAIFTKVLLQRLHDMEDRPYRYDWRGPDDTKPSRPLNDQTLSDFLRPYNIRPKTVWPDGPRVPGGSGKGYYAQAFKELWASQGVTPSHPRKFKDLRPGRHVTSPDTIPAQEGELEFG